MVPGPGSTSHRVAVTRALRKMVLPSTWGVLALWRQGNEYCLYNRCDLESTLRYTYLGWWREAPIDFATWKDRFPHHIEIAENKVSDACRYRDALPLGKIEIERTATAIKYSRRRLSVR